ncbi:MAG TPA: response regulator [Bacteroidota bacterium]|nr:response regulator [Bacteroidota bacterium]
MKPLFSKKLILAFSAALAIFLLIFYLGYLNTQKLIQAQTQVERSHSIIDHLKNILTHVTSAETGQRGYLITGRKEYLMPYLESRRAIESEMLQLLALVDEHAVQRERAVRLDSLIQERMERLQRTIEVREKLGFEAARQVVQTNIGKQAMDEIRFLIGTMESEERTLLLERELVVLGNAERIYAIASIGGVFALLVILAAILVLYLDVREYQRTVELLRASEERYDLAVHGSNAGMWDWNIKTNDVYYSPRWKSMLGYEDHEIMNRYEEWEKLLHPEDKERVIAAVREYLEGKSPEFELEYRLRQKDGTYRWVLARGVCLRDEQGRPYRMAGSHIDVHARKQLEQDLRESEKRYRQLVEVASDIFYRADTQGYFTYANLVGLRVVGYSEEELKKMRYVDLIRPDYRREAERFYALQYARKTPNTYFEFPIIVKDGREIWLGQNVQLLEERGEIVGFQATARDITEKRRAEEELRVAKQRAEEATKAKSEFLANMSHEIRTPMNGIIGMTDLLLDTELSKQQREYLEMVKSSADSLLRIINDILDFSKIEAGKFDLDHAPFRLRESLGTTMKMLALRAEKKGLEVALRIQPDVPDSLIGDLGRLQQVLINLVGNAIKFTEKGEVVVTVSVEERRGQEVMLHFAVRDTGIGIPKEKQQLIFEAFTQADASTTRHYGGTGLGLSISAGIISLMKGRIWVESKPGLGSTFHATALFGVGQEGEWQDTVHLKNKTVLVVDDHETNRLILKEMLSQWGMNVTAVDDGKAALEAVRQRSGGSNGYDLIILDANMPEMNGFDVAEEIHRLPGLKNQIVLMLSSTAHPEEVERCRKIGRCSYITKPVSQSSLLNAMMDALHPGMRGGGLPTYVEQKTTGLKILLAEDNEVNRLVATAILQKKGHEVVHAENGTQALEAVRQRRFDLILMDVQMPDMDGLQATAAIRAWEQSIGRHTPIVAMTAHAMKGDRERFLAAGMDDYIAKPINSQELLAILSRVAARAPHAVEQSPPEVQKSTVLFDRRRTMQILGDSQELFAEFVRIFLAKYEGYLQEIHRAIEDGDWPRLEWAVHTLLGSSVYFTTRDHLAPLQDLEICVRERKQMNLDGLYRQVKQVVDKLAEEIRRDANTGP